MSLEINKIYQEDCLEGMDGIVDNSIDMILCDLPYGTTQNKWDVVIDLSTLWKQYLRVAKENAAIVLTAAQPFATDLIQSNRKHFKYDLIWEKSIATGFLNAKKMPLRGHEHVLIFYRKSPVYNPQKNLLKTPSFRRGNNRRSSSNYGEYQNGLGFGSTDGSRFPRSVFSISYEPEFFDSTKNDKNKTVHPTQKPLGLFDYLIKTYSNPGDTVLDSCMGSGTTAIACINTGRNFIGFENNPKYFADASHRINEAKVAKQFSLNL